MQFEHQTMLGAVCVEFSSAAVWVKAEIRLKSEIISVTGESLRLGLLAIMAYHGAANWRPSMAKHLPKSNCCFVNIVLLTGGTSATSLMALTVPARQIIWSGNYGSLESSLYSDFGFQLEARFVEQQPETGRKPLVLRFESAGIHSSALLSTLSAIVSWTCTVLEQP